MMPRWETGKVFLILNFARVITSEDFEVIQDLVKKISSEEQPFERMVVPKEVALEMFKVK